MIDLVEIGYAIRWWAILTVIGVAAVPLGGWLFAPLADRGYAFSKMLGLLLSSYIFWLLATLGVLSNSVGGILTGVVTVGVLSYWAFQKTGGEIWSWIRKNWRYVIFVELLFAVLFFTWVWVRAQNPAITATEKPMEFAFLNAATFSPTYPPLDPWLSEFAISYYYFGYVMISAVGRLAQVAPAYGFNLGIAWLVAGSGVGALGLVYNLTAAASKRRALAWGGMASVALPLAGNGQMLLEILHGSGLGGQRFWQWLDIRDINGPVGEQMRFLTAGGTPNGSWWWWRASRVIHEYYLSGRPEEGLEPIAEFPGFSFLLGDMHPHVLALPFAFLSLGVALSWYYRYSQPDYKVEPGLWSFLGSFWQGDQRPLFILTAVIIGGLSFLNTWDVLIHLFILVGSFTLAVWARQGWSTERLIEALLFGALMVAVVYLLYLPFYLGFSSQAGAPFILPMMMRPTRLAHFWVIFGRSLLVLIPFLIIAARYFARERHFWSSGIRFAIALPLGLMLLAFLFIGGLAASDSGFGFIMGPTSDLGLVLPQRAQGIDFSWSWAVMGGFIPVYLINRGRYIALTLLLSAILAGVIAIWNGYFAGRQTQNLLENEEGNADRQTADVPLPFVLLLVFTAVLLSMGPEFVYLKDNFGQRLNTIFKFYYQAWILYGAAALFALDFIWRKLRPAGVVLTSLYAILLAVALLYPLQGVRSRAVEYRGPSDIENRRAATIDGLDFLSRGQSAELEAITWLLENASPDAVIVEATGNPYSYFARFSANTGRPTILGWANHQFQWRGTSTDEPAVRGSLVNEIYDSTDWERTASLLNQFDVSYIIVGSLETTTYSSTGLEKFPQNLSPVFANEVVEIYPWQSTP